MKNVISTHHLRLGFLGNKLMWRFADANQTAAVVSGNTCKRSRIGREGMFYPDAAAVEPSAALTGSFSAGMVLRNVLGLRLSTIRCGLPQEGVCVGWAGCSLQLR